MVAETLDQATRMEAPRAVALCRSFGALVQMQEGDWSRAEAELVAAVDMYAGIGAAMGVSVSCQRLGALLTAKGRIDEALAVLHRGEASARQAVLRHHCLTRVYATLAR